MLFVTTDLKSCYVNGFTGPFVGVDTTGSISHLSYVHMYYPLSGK